MIYVLRLIYAWFLPPGIFIFAFLPAYYMFTKTNEILWLTLPILLIYLLSIGFMSDLLIKPLENYYPQPSINELKTAQAIVVLGGGYYKNVPDFDGEGQLSNISASRLLMGLRLHKVLNIPVIISGGTGFSLKIAEAEIAARTLKACGVDEKYIILENKSRNTLENVKLTKILCENNGFKRIILVTSAVHLPRSVMLFQRENVEIIPYPSDYGTNMKTIIDMYTLIPNRFSLNNTASAMKEYLGILAIKLGLQ